MFLRADDVGHMHEAVVNDHRIIIGRNSVRFDNDKIPDPIGIKFHVAPDQVVDNDLFIGRHTQTDRRLAAFRFIFCNLFRRQFPAFSHIAGHFSFFQKTLPFFLQLFRRTVAVIRFSLCQQLVCIFLIDVQPLHLAVRTVRTSYINAFVPVHAQPS